jgi:hypothetical protein
MIQTLIAIILAPIALVAAIFTLAIVYGCFYGLVQSFRKPKKKSE